MKCPRNNGGCIGNDNCRSMKYQASHTPAYGQINQ